jgi:4-hydroxybenzoate polyprenyltransferase
LVAIGAAWIYNLGLKKSVFSIVGFLVGFGVLPAIATLARPVPAAPALWATGVAALLGAAGHFANTLPDLDDDAATGVRGLPQVLGRRWSSALTYLILLAASILEFFGTGGFAFIPADIGLGAAIVITAVGGAMILRPTRWHFRSIILAALIDVVVLVFAGSRILS